MEGLVETIDRDRGDFVSIMSIQKVINLNFQVYTMDNVCLLSKKKRQCLPLKININSIMTKEM